MRGQSDTSCVFNVNAQAGFSAPGADGGAVLGGNLTLSLTSGYAGTVTAKGDVTYLVEADAPGPIDTLWRWSGTSNVDAGGSCRATVSIGGVTRSMTATTHDQPVLEIPVTARHGDVLQAKLDATCTSPGLLAGPPEIFVNANIGVGLLTPAISEARLMARRQCAGLIAAQFLGGSVVNRTTVATGHCRDRNRCPPAILAPEGSSDSPA